MMPPLTQQINPMTDKPNKWILPIISKVIDDRMPQVLITGTVLTHRVREDQLLVLTLTDTRPHRNIGFY
jgi:hypothetical protein